MRLHRLGFAGFLERSFMVGPGLFLVGLAVGPAWAQQIGPGALGAQSIGSGAATIVGNTNISASTTAVTVGSGGSVLVDPNSSLASSGPISITATGSAGALAVNGGTATLSPGSQAITITGGNNLPALMARNGSITINAGTGSGGVTVNANNTGSALYATTGGSINASGVAINAGTGTSGGYAAIADLGGTITIGAGSTVTSNPNYGLAFGAIGTGSQVTLASPVPVTLNGRQAVGVYMLNGGQVSIPSGTIFNFNGYASDGIIANNSNATMLGSGLQLNFNNTTTTQSSIGLTATNNGSIVVNSVAITGNNVGIGVLARAGGTVTITGTNQIVIADGVGSPALQALTNNTLQFYTQNAAGVITGTGAFINGQTAFSTPAGLYADNNGTINSTGTTINVTHTTGALAYGVYALSNGTVNFDNNTVNVTGATATGLGTNVSNSVAGVSLINGENSNVTVSGGENGAIFYQNYSTASSAIPGQRLEEINLTNTKVSATNGTIGVVAIGNDNGLNVLNMSGGSLTSANDNALLAVGNFDASFSNGAVVSGGDGTLANAETSSGTSTNFNLSADDSTLTGNAVAESGAILNITETNGTAWTGAASNVNNASVSDSLWTVTGNSDVGTLSLGVGSVVFAAPVGNTFKTVTVRGDYASTGAASSVTFNTMLNDGGALSNQFTDRLLIAGNANGSTTVNVENAGGAGGITSADVPNASEGISLIQVAGNSTQNAFTLRGGYVTGGTPFAYHLNAYGPDSSYGEADSAQSLVANTGTYWDYRLQTAYEDPEGPVDPETGEPEPGPNPPEPLPPDTRREVAPQVPAYISTPTALFQAGFLDIDSLHRRLGEIRDEQTLGYDPKNEVFVRAFGGWFNYKSNQSFENYGYNFNADYSALQFGANHMFVDNKDGTLRLGLAGTLGRMWLTPSAIDGPSKGLYNTQTLSGIATWQDRDGWYLDGILSGGLFDGVYSTQARGRVLGMNGTSFAVSLEGGYPFDLPWWKLNLEPQAQIVWQHLQFASRADVDGLNVDMGSPNQGVLRLGFRLKRPFLNDDDMLITPYFKANLLQGLGSGGHVTLSGDQFSTGSYGTALQVGAGITGTLTRNIAVYGDVAWQSHVTTGGFRGWLANAGLRYDFGSAPPPPPAPNYAPVAAPAPVAARSYLVFFDWDRADLTARARTIIANAAQNSAQSTSILVNGYTDTTGSAQYNLGLSLRRAKAVQAELVRDGVPAEVIAIHGYGDTKLLVPTGPGVREPQNRRVEIIVE